MLRSKRPLAGVAIRVYVPLVLIVGALLFSLRGAPFWAVLGLALVVFALFPALVSALLRPIEREVLAATPKSAPALVDRLRSYRRVRLLAPFAWTAFQEGRLHMIRGDGRAAAKCLSEAARLGGASADPPASLLSAQAHAHLIAEAPEPAREVLAAVLKRQPLGPWDELHLGAALLLVGKVRAEEALRHIDAAQAALGATPRVLAARALAEQRAGDSDSALAALKAAEAGLLAEPDRLGQLLVDRARRLLRPAAKAQDKRDRKREARSGRRQDERAQAPTRKDSPSVVVTPPASAAPAMPGKETLQAGPVTAVVQVGPVKVEPATAAVQVAPATPALEGAPAPSLPAAPKPAAPAERAKGKRKTRREERRAARRAAKAERRASQRTGPVVGRGSAPTRRTAALSVTATARVTVGESVAPPSVAPKVEAAVVERIAPKIEAASRVVVEQAPKAVAEGAAPTVERPVAERAASRVEVEQAPKVETAAVERAAPKVEAVERVGPRVEARAVEPRAEVVPPTAAVERASPRVEAVVEHAAPQVKVERPASRVEAAPVAERAASRAAPVGATAPSVVAAPAAPASRPPEPERKESAVKAPAGTSLFGWLKEPAPQRAGWPAPPTLSTGGLPRAPAAPSVPAAPVVPVVRESAVPVAPRASAPSVEPPAPAGGRVAPPPVPPPTSSVPVHLVPPVAVAPPLVAPAIAPAIPAAVSAAGDAEWDSLLDTLAEDPGLPPNLSL